MKWNIDFKFQNQIKGHNEYIDRWNIHIFLLAGRPMRIATNNDAQFMTQNTHNLIYYLFLWVSSLFSLALPFAITHVSNLCETHICFEMQLAKQWSMFVCFIDSILRCKSNWRTNTNYSNNRCECDWHRRRKNRDTATIERQYRIEQNQRKNI